MKLDKPDVKLMLTNLTWRGDDSAGQQFLTEPRPAFDVHKADRFSDAAMQFHSLSARYPKSVEIFLYMGVARLSLGEYAAATKDLETTDGLAGGRLPPTCPATWR